MIDSVIKDRLQKLYEINIIERRKLFPLEIKQIDHTASERGMFQSSVRILQIHQAHEHELGIRSMLAWQSLYRVHQIFGAPTNTNLREDFKLELNELILKIFNELNDSYKTYIHNSSFGVKNSLDEAHSIAISKHDIEIDLYIDSISANITQDTKSMTQNYNFYGSIGAVQTSTGATANVVQNLNVVDKVALEESLKQVKLALEATQTVEKLQKNELIEIAQDCINTINTNTPNNTKLLTMFNVLGTSIQSIASAQPAYQALKIAVLPLGINLP